MRASIVRILLEQRLKLIEYKIEYKKETKNNTSSSDFKSCVTDDTCASFSIHAWIMLICGVSNH